MLVKHNSEEAHALSTELRQRRKTGTGRGRPSPKCPHQTSVCIMNSAFDKPRCALYLDPKFQRSFQAPFTHTLHSAHGGSFTQHPPSYGAAPGRAPVRRRRSSAAARNDASAAAWTPRGGRAGCEVRGWGWARRRWSRAVAPAHSRSVGEESGAPTNELGYVR